MQLSAPPLAALGRWLAGAALALAVTAGCAAPVALVTRGEVVSTGNPTYDDFFAAVRQIHTEAVAAASDEQSAHVALIRALGLEPTAKRTLAIDESGLRAKKLSDKGVFLHLELTPEAHMLTARGKVDLGPESEALLRAMEDAARTGLEMRKRFATLVARATDLEKKRIDLRAQAPADFRDGPQDKRDRVILELDGATAVLAEALDKSSLAAGSAARFAVELAQTLETGAEEAAAKAAKGAPRRPAITLQLVPAPPPVASAPPPPPPAPPPVPPPLPPPPAPPPPTKPTAGRPAAAKPAAGATRPAPAAGAPAVPVKKKPKGGDDFEP
jgi:hypothetical protein